MKIIYPKDKFKYKQCIFKNEYFVKLLGLNNYCELNKLKFNEIMLNKMKSIQYPCYSINKKKCVHITVASDSYLKILQDLTTSFFDKAINDNYYEKSYKFTIDNCFESIKNNYGIEFLKYKHTIPVINFHKVNDNILVMSNNIPDVNAVGTIIINTVYLDYIMCKKYNSNKKVDLFCICNEEIDKVTLELVVLYIMDIKPFEVYNEIYISYLNSELLTRTVLIINEKDKRTEKLAVKNNKNIVADALFTLNQRGDIGNIKKYDYNKKLFLGMLSLCISNVSLISKLKVDNVNENKLSVYKKDIYKYEMFNYIDSLNPVIILLILFALVCIPCEMFLKNEISDDYIRNINDLFVNDLDVLYELKDGTVKSIRDYNWKDGKNKYLIERIRNSITHFNVSFFLQDSEIYILFHDENKEGKDKVDFILKANKVFEFINKSIDHLSDYIDSIDASENNKLNKETIDDLKLLVANSVLLLNIDLNDDSEKAIVNLNEIYKYNYINNNNVMNKIMVIMLLFILYNFIFYLTSDESIDKTLSSKITYYVTISLNATFSNEIEDIYKFIRNSISHYSYNFECKDDKLIINLIGEYDSNTCISLTYDDLLKLLYFMINTINDTINEMKNE